MAEAVETLEGWYCLHDLRTIDWSLWKQTAIEKRKQAIEEFQQLLSDCEHVEEQEVGSHVMHQVIGQKADLMFMFLRPTVDALMELETTINKSQLGEFLKPAYSYFSVVELTKDRARRGEDSPAVQARLKPILPKWRYMSFYPMSRRRFQDENWFTLDKDERKGLLYEHSKTGRKYAHKVRQVTTGSVGFDEWEWAVSLFTDDVLQLKKIVYEMRFDEASARYGLFGDFYIGKYLTKEALNNYLSL